MSRKYHCLRNPRTTAEKRANQEGWCRAKRRSAHLVDAWDDKPHGCQKNWKEFRKKQYYPEGRGQKHTIFIKDNEIISIWYVEEYFRNHNIPYLTKRIREATGKGKVPICKATITGYKPYYHYKYTTTKDANGKRVTTKIKTLWFYIPVYDWYTIGYRDVTYYHTLGYEFSWWSNKDVGIEYILQECKLNRTW